MGYFIVMVEVFLYGSENKYEMSLLLVAFYNIEEEEIECIEIHMLR